MLITREQGLVWHCNTKGDVSLVSFLQPYVDYTREQRLVWHCNTKGDVSLVSFLQPYVDYQGAGVSVAL